MTSHRQRIHLQAAHGPLLLLIPCPITGKNPLLIPCPTFLVECLSNQTKKQKQEATLPNDQTRLAVSEDSATYFARLQEPIKLTTLNQWCPACNAPLKWLSLCDTQSCVQK